MLRLTTILFVLCSAAVLGQTRYMNKAAVDTIAPNTKGVVRVTDTVMVTGAVDATKGINTASFYKIDDSLTISNVSADNPLLWLDDANDILNLLGFTGIGPVAFSPTERLVVKGNVVVDSTLTVGDHFIATSNDSSYIGYYSNDGSLFFGFDAENVCDSNAYLSVTEYGAGISTYISGKASSTIALSSGDKQIEMTLTDLVSSQIAGLYFTEGKIRATADTISIYSPMEETKVDLYPDSLVLTSDTTILEGNLILNGDLIYEPNHAFLTYKVTGNDTIGGSSAGNVISIATQWVWTKFALGFTDTETHGFALVATDTLKYTGTTAGHALFQIPITVDGENTVDWEIAIFNVTDAATKPIATRQAFTTTGAGNKNSVTISAYDVNCNPNDKYVIKVRNLSNTDDLNVFYCDLMAWITHFE